MNTIIVKKIQLESKHLGLNIEKYLYGKINRNMTGNCYKDYGYIIKLHPEIEIIDNEISSANSNVIFSVKICVDLLKPSIGNIYNGKVFMINDSGILAKIMGKMSIWISFNKLSEFTYNVSSDGSSACYTNEDIELKNGMDINVEITFFKYEDKNYSCIGKYVKNIINLDIEDSDSETETNSESETDIDSNLISEEDT